jgi:hypothetical protein
MRYERASRRGRPATRTRLRTWNAKVVQLVAMVTAHGELDLRCGVFDFDSDYDDDYDGDRGGLRALPEGFSRLVYLSRPGLKRLDHDFKKELTSVPAGLWSLMGLEELNLRRCGLDERAEGIRRLTGFIHAERGLQALLAYPRSEAVEGVHELDLACCVLMALPEGTGSSGG